MTWKNTHYQKRIKIGTRSKMKGLLQIFLWTLWYTVVHEIKVSQFKKSLEDLHHQK